MVASASGAASRSMVRVTRSAGRSTPAVTSRSISGYAWAGMPWLPSSSSSYAITRSIGSAGRPCAAGSSPTCTCRPRRRRPSIDATQVA